MGYTTEFEGSISITPALPPDRVRAVNAFCDERHQDDRGLRRSDAPSVRCDWSVSRDGASIAWNGSEKSYEMPRWLEVLIRRFFTGHVLNGELHARGEEHEDMWTLVCKDNVVSTRRAEVRW